MTLVSALAADLPSPCKRGPVDQRSEELLIPCGGRRWGRWRRRGGRGDNRRRALRGGAAGRRPRWLGDRLRKGRRACWRLDEWRPGRKGYRWLCRKVLARAFLGGRAREHFIDAVESAFGSAVDYAMLVKIYGTDREAETRYSPAECMGCRSIPIIGKPDPKHISTSYVERQNWSVRTAMRRYTRLSNGFSRKIENHAAAIALNYFAYNFIKIHRTLRVSPAMAAGVTDRLWDAGDLVSLLESEERTKRAA
jgi:hypothetical protein